MAKDNGSVSMGRGDFDALLAALDRIAAGEYSERVSVDTADEGIARLRDAFNAALQSVDDHLGEDREATMNLALGMAECFNVLGEVRRGNLAARVGEDLLTREDDLISSFGRALNDTIADIEAQIATIQRQEDTQAAMEHLVRQLQTPILQLWDDVLALPVIGMVDSRRSAEMMGSLLDEIMRRRCKYVILDITGVEIVDTRTADHFVKVMKSAELLGARCVMTGIRPAVAQTLVELGVDLTSINTLRNLQEGLRFCLREMEQSRAGGRLAAEG
ncbi:MAG: STAS domain-containing protein [Actinobacteria bacterium]|nr:MAG: STAS domain-containing protein [Actinomycetota bacterium]